MAMKFSPKSILANLGFLLLGLLDITSIIGAEEDFHPPLALGFLPIILFPIARLLVIHELSVREKAGKKVIVPSSTLMRSFISGFFELHKSLIGSVTFMSLSYAIGSLLSSLIFVSSIHFETILIFCGAFTFWIAEFSAYRQWNEGKRSPVL